MRDRPSGDAAARIGLVLASICWGSAFIGSKYVLRDLTPLVAAGARFVLAGVLLVPAAWRAWPARVPTGVAGLLAGLVVLGGFVYPWLFFEAIARTTATKTALLIALNPTITWLLGPLVGDALEGRRIAALGLALLGAWTVITHGRLDELATIGHATGDLLALAAAIVWAVYNLGTRPVVAQIAPAVVNCLTYVLGGAALLAVAAGEHPMTQLLAARADTLLALAFLALVPSVVAAQLFLVGVQRLGVAQAVPYINLVPLNTTLMAVVLLGEQVGWSEGAGGLAVLVGVWLGSAPRSTTPAAAPSDRPAPAPARSTDRPDRRRNTPPPRSRGSE